MYVDVRRLFLRIITAEKMLHNPYFFPFLCAILIACHVTFKLIPTSFFS